MDRGGRKCFAHRANRFRQASGGFAGRRGERDPQVLAARLLEEERQDSHHGPRFPGARPARDDGEITRDRFLRRHFLQVAFLFAF